MHLPTVNASSVSLDLKALYKSVIIVIIIMNRKVIFKQCFCWNSVQCQKLQVFEVLSFSLDTITRLLPC